MFIDGTTSWLVGGGTVQWLIEALPENVYTSSLALQVIFLNINKYDQYRLS